jgi:hypothetical protein
VIWSRASVRLRLVTVLLQESIAETGPAATVEWKSRLAADFRQPAPVHPQKV